MAYLIDAEIEQLKKLDKVREALECTIDVVDYGADNSLTAVTAKEILDQFENLYVFMQKIERVCGSANVNPFVIFGAYNDIENELQMLNNAHRSDDYVFDMLLRQMNIERDRQERKITINKQQLQKMLHVLVKKFGRPDKRRFYLFLDEFQDYSAEELTDIKTAVSEAVTNAILHGYDSDPAKQVELSCQFSDRTVTVTVRDRGHGIEDIALAMEPFYTSRPELERSGMGFTVMQTFMDELEVHSAREEGTVVRMTKRLSPRDEGVAP